MSGYWQHRSEMADQQRERQQNREPDKKVDKSCRQHGWAEKAAEEHGPGCPHCAGQQGR